MFLNFMHQLFIYYCCFGFAFCFVSLWTDVLLSLRWLTCWRVNVRAGKLNCCGFIMCCAISACNNCIFSFISMILLNKCKQFGLEILSVYLLLLVFTVLYVQHLCFFVTSLDTCCICNLFLIYYELNC